MASERQPYHAHIYYGEDSRSPIADEVCKDLAAKFSVELGKNNGVAGPHLIAQRQVIFRTSAFAEIVPWLMFNRQGLDILIHPLTDDEYDDQHEGPQQVPIDDAQSLVSQLDEARQVTEIVTH